MIMTLHVADGRRPPLLNNAAPKGFLRAALLDRVDDGRGAPETRPRSTEIGEKDFFVPSGLGGRLIFRSGIMQPACVAASPAT